MNNTLPPEALEERFLVHQYRKLNEFGRVALIASAQGLITNPEFLKQQPSQDAATADVIELHPKANTKEPKA